LSIISNIMDSIQEGLARRISMALGKLQTIVRIFPGRMEEVASPM